MYASEPCSSSIKLLSPVVLDTFVCSSFAVVCLLKQMAIGRNLLTLNSRYLLLILGTMKSRLFGICDVTQFKLGDTVDI
jgi:hypothetical protein